MDELELLKKDWKKQEAYLPRISYDNIYKMLWKKSSSIVKWIFIISILEFLFWALLNILMADRDYWNEMERMHLTNFTIGVYLINYIIVFYFIICFYKNYTKISTVDNASTLMKNILKTRKTVKYYITYVLISSVITLLIYTYFMLYDHASTIEVEDATKYNFDTLDWVKFAGIVSIFVIIFLGMVWLFYRLIYGILLKRLYKNYKELKKMEV